MRILMVSVEDVHDVRSWSGTPFHMLRALSDAGHEVVSASPLRQRLNTPLKGLQWARNVVGRTYYSRLREPVVLKGYARQVERQIAHYSPDLVLSPSSLPVSHLDTSVPVVTWTDATFAGLIDFNPTFTNLSPRYLKLGHRAEQECLERACLSVFSSGWAARTAVDSYGADPDRIAVVPYGANFTGPVSRGSTAHTLGTCRLLIVGRGWMSKGVDLAVATAAALRERGVPAVLDVVGCSPPNEVQVPDFVTVHGSLEKDDEAASSKLYDLFRKASFFVLPTRADCTPIVLAEAQAYGVPVIVSDVGGVSSMLRPGVSGHVVGLDGFAESAATWIAAAWASGESYSLLSAGAKNVHKELLNWPRAVDRLLEAVRRRGLLASQPPRSSSGPGSPHRRAVSS